MFGKWSKKSNSVNENADVVLKVLGTGCKNCNLLEMESKSAIEEMGINARVDHVNDFVQIAKYGVMKTPALVVNEKLVLSGYVAKKDEIIEKVNEVINNG